MGGPYSAGGAPSSSEYDEGHLAMTYTALAVLVILRTRSRTRTRTLALPALAVCSSTV